MKRTDNPIITEHLDIRIVTEEPDADEIAKAQRDAIARMRDAADPGAKFDDGDPQVQALRGLVGINAMQQFGPMPNAPHVKRYLLIRKTGADAGEYARIDPHEARLLEHLLREIAIPRGICCH